jgi:hypothetical protein
MDFGFPSGVKMFFFGLRFYVPLYFPSLSPRDVCTVASSKGGRTVYEGSLTGAAGDHREGIQSRVFPVRSMRRLIQGPGEASAIKNVKYINIIEHKP